MLRLIIQTKRKYKKIEKQDIEPKEEKEIVDMTETCSTDDESGDGQSTKSKYDVDSEVTFDEDSDKEMDTISIEEEDWIEYIKKEAQLTLWTRWNVQRFVAGTGHTKNEMEIGTENRNITE